MFNQKIIIISAARAVVMSPRVITDFQPKPFLIRSVSWAIASESLPLTNPSYSPGNKEGLTDEPFQRDRKGKQFHDNSAYANTIHRAWRRACHPPPTHAREIQIPGLSPRRRSR